MTKLAPEISRLGFAVERSPIVSAFRTMLVGAFAEENCDKRLRLERLLATPPAGRGHCVLPVSGLKEQVDEAEAALARNAVDIVLLDLDGPVPALLSLLARLRATAAETVVFIGILPSGASMRTRLYLGAVVDEVVEGPPGADVLHRAIARALYAASAFQSPCIPAVAGTPTRH